MMLKQWVALAAMAVGTATWAEGPTAGEEAPKKAEAVAETRAAEGGTGSAEAARDKLFGGEGAKAAVTPAVSEKTEKTAAVGTVAPVGPNEPKVKVLMEGTLIYKRVGRLSKDEKSGQYIFSFDSDGKEMRDPPMIVLPSKTLATMEGMSELGLRPVRFQVTGEVTEYKGKNFLLVHAVLVLRDLNQGIGGT